MTAKSHHYNPQVYLRQFLYPHSKLLWEYDVQKGTVRADTPKNLGCEDYYHSFHNVEGRRDDDSIETTLSHFESKLPQLFNTVRNRNGMTAELWSILFIFAGLQRSRCPKSVDTFQIGMSQVYQKLYNIWKYSPDFDEAMRKEGLDPNKERLSEFEIKADRGNTICTLFSAFGQGNLPKLFARMKWAFFIAPERKYFFTSDDPVCCWIPPTKKGTAAPAHTDVEIYFPLSRSVCAFAQWHVIPPQLYNPLTPENLDLINKRNIANAWRYVYGPLNDPGVMAVVTQLVSRGQQAQSPPLDGPNGI